MSCVACRLAVVALCVALAFGCGREPEPAAPPTASEPAASAARQGTPETNSVAGTSAAPAEWDSSRPEPTLQLLNYEEIQELIASKAGQIVVLDCWSTSCEPCMKEFPGLVDLHQKFGPQVACISLSVDYEGIGKPEDQKPKVLAFLKEQGALFDNILATEESDEIFRKMQFGGPPIVIVYNRDGSEARRFDHSDPAHAFTYADISAYVEELMKQR